MKQFDHLCDRLDKLEQTNREDHATIIKKIDDWKLHASKSFVTWRVIGVILPLILGNFCFTWVVYTILTQK